jgi:hypothetical protein
MPLGQETLPLVGELEGNGLTTLPNGGSMLTNPQVTVILRQAKNDVGVCFGEMAKLGPYLSGKPTTVVGLLTREGGYQ